MKYNVNRENCSGISKKKKGDVIKILKYIPRKQIEFHTDDINRDVTKNSGSPIFFWYRNYEIRIRIFNGTFL